MLGFSAIAALPIADDGIASSVSTSNVRITARLSGLPAFNSKSDGGSTDANAESRGSTDFNAFTSGN